MERSSNRLPCKVPSRCPAHGTQAPREVAATESAEGSRPASGRKASLLMIVVGEQGREMMGAVGRVCVGICFAEGKQSANVCDGVLHLAMAKQDPQTGSLTKP